MPTIECQSCRALIEFGPQRGSFRVSCLQCKRLTTVPDESGVTGHVAPVSNSYRPPNKVHAQWAIVNGPKPHSFRMKLFPRKPGNLALVAIAYTVAIGLLGGFVLLFWFFGRPNQLHESNGIAIDSARKRMPENASTNSSDRAAVNIPRSSSPNKVSALESALAIPQSTDSRDWLSQDHKLRLRAPEMRLVAFNRWEDKSNRVVRWDGNVQVVDESIAPDQYIVRANVDHAYAWELERHFGYPERLGISWTYENDGDQKAMDVAQSSAYHQHGIQVQLQQRSHSIGPDYSWIVDNSAPKLRAVASEVVRAVTRQAKANTRTSIAALTSYIQYAIPYTKDVSGEQRERFHDDKNRCGLRTPLATLLVGGDCDSKSLLLLTMMRAIDPDVRLAIIRVRDSNFPLDPATDVNHTITGIVIAPQPGERTLRRGDVTYVLIESTAGLGVGRLSPSTKLDTARVDPIP